MAEDSHRRFTKKEIAGGHIIDVARGPRREMLARKQELVERNPGPENREPWAGAKRDEQ